MTFLISYIDPGSGSLILQMLIAGVVGAAAFFRRGIFAFFSRRSLSTPAVDASTPSTAEAHSSAETRLPSAKDSAS